MLQQFRRNRIGVFALKRGFHLGLLIFCGYFVISFMVANLFQSAGGSDHGFSPLNDRFRIRPLELQQSAKIDAQSWNSDANNLTNLTTDIQAQSWNSTAGNLAIRRKNKDGKEANIKKGCKMLKIFCKNQSKIDFSFWKSRNSSGV